MDEKRGAPQGPPPSYGDSYPTSGPTYPTSGSAYTPSGQPYPSYGPAQYNYGPPMTNPGYTAPQYNTRYGGGSQQQATTVVVNQPQAFRAVPTYAQDNLGLAIFATICCFWPLGILAILRSQESRRAVDRGDMNSATALSTQARRYSIWAIAMGCVSYLLIVIILVVYFVALNNYDYWDDDYYK